MTNFLIRRSNVSACCFPLLIVSIAVTSASARTWTDSTGAFQVEAELVGVENGVVTLRKEDGKVIAVPLDRLSATDRKFLAQRRPALNGNDPPEDKPPRPLPMGGDAGGAAPNVALTRKVKVSFAQTPLHEVLRFLAAESGGPILIDHRELDASGVAGDQPVTLEDNGTLHDVLTRVLKPLELVHTIHHDVIYITTPVGAESYQSTVVYRLKRRVNFDELIEGITSTVQPESWADVGGPGSIEPLALGGLLVAQTWAGHQEIQKSFGDMIEPLPTPEVVGTTKLAKALATRHRASFIETPLTDVADFFADLTGTRVRIDEAALADIGIRPDVAVSLHDAELPVASALSLVLEPYDMVWMRDKADIVITTPEAMEENMTVVRYSLQGMTARPDAADAIQAITSTIAPASWDQVGGPGSIKAVAPGQVAIRQSDEVHRQIEALLATLQAKR